MNKVNQPRTAPAAPPFHEALVRLEDELAEFADLSSFICNAYALSLKEPQWLTPEVASGARICAGWLQDRTRHLRDELHRVQLHFQTINKKGR